MLSLSDVAHLVRGVVARERARGVAMTNMVVEAGRVEHVARRVPKVKSAPAGEAVAATLDLGASLARLRACPCETCRAALGRLDGIPAGHVRVFLHDRDGERVVHLPFGWFDAVIAGGGS